MDKTISYNFAKISHEDLIKLPFVKQQDSSILLSVYIQPNASETAIIGLHDSKLKIKIATPPTDGKANKTLCRFIAEQFSVPMKNVTILKGESSRTKVLKIVRN